MKTAPDHYSSSTKLYSWHYAFRQISVLLESVKPRFCKMVKHDSSLQRTHFHFSRVQWRQALHHSSRCLALCMVILGLCAAGQPGKPISWSSQRAFLVMALLPKAVWNLVVSVETEDRPSSHSVSLCGLPLHGWAVVAPRCFHFTITALTVDRDSSIRAEMWRTNLLERWHPMTVPRWKSFYWQCLSVEIAWLCAQFYTPVVAEIAESTNLKGWPHTFVYIVYIVLTSEYANVS